MNWGLGQADSEGSQCYVESSPAARYLCTRKGFRHVAEMRIELGKYKEGYQDYRHSVMIRPAYGEEEPPRPPSKLDPFEDAAEMSPIDDMEESYTAEAKMLEFRSSSSLKSARLRDTRSSTTSSSLMSGKNRDLSRALPRTPKAG